MKILIWKSKYENVYIDMTNELAAFYKMFTMLNEAEAYGDLTDGEPGNEEQVKLYNAAKSGDSRAAKRLIKIRRLFDYEYEEFSVADVIDPLVE